MISGFPTFSSKKIKSISSSDVLIARKTITLLISAQNNNVYHGRSFVDGDVIKKLFFWASRAGYLRFSIAESHSWTKSFSRILRKTEMPVLVFIEALQIITWLSE